MTKVYLHTEEMLESFVVCKQEVVVGGYGAQFRKPLFDLEERLLHLFYRNGEHVLNECSTCLSFDDGEQVPLAALPRHDEISLDITNPCSCFYYVGPFVDERAIRELFGTPPFLATLLLFQ